MAPLRCLAVCVLLTASSTGFATPLSNTRPTVCPTLGCDTLRSNNVAGLAIAASASPKVAWVQPPATPPLPGFTPAGCATNGGAAVCSLGSSLVAVNVSDGGALVWVRPTNNTPPMVPLVDFTGAAVGCDVASVYKRSPDVAASWTDVVQPGSWAGCMSPTLLNTVLLTFSSPGVLYVDTPDSVPVASLTFALNSTAYLTRASPATNAGATRGYFVTTANATCAELRLWALEKGSGSLQRLHVPWSAPASPSLCVHASTRPVGPVTVKAPSAGGDASDVVVAAVPASGRVASPTAVVAFADAGGSGAVRWQVQLRHHVHFMSAANGTLWLTVDNSSLLVLDGATGRVVGAAVSVGAGVALTTPWLVAGGGTAIAAGMQPNGGPALYSVDVASGRTWAWPLPAAATTQPLVGQLAPTPLHWVWPTAEPQLRLSSWAAPSPPPPPPPVLLVAQAADGTVLAFEYET